MGQTLSHGVYLPNEGERNCYAGLASNWQILNTAVGAIAEKAPLVHTHTVSQITDFPAYGTTAGTICEGNDSRLSDARTPVAHTHGKADITDLFNSANTWTSINTSQREICISGDRDAYIAPMWEGASSGIAFLNSDATKTFVFGQYTTDANNRKAIDGTKGRLLIRTGERNGETVVDFEPRATNAILGSVTNRFKSLNGVNPGALCLPRGYTEEGADKHYINIASVIQTLDGTIYNYTMPDNGWICVRAEQAQQVHVTLSTWYFGQSVSHPTGSTLIVSVPFRKNDQISLRVKAVSLQYARFYPMQGNV